MDAIVSYLQRTFQFADEFHLPITLFTLGFYGALGLIERVMPAEKNHRWGGKLRNVGFGLIKYILGTVMVVTVVAWLPWEIAIVRGGGWQETLIYVGGFLFLADFIYYWYHRAQHAFRWFWPVHEMHHADAELNVTTTYRTYPLEGPLQFLLIGYPILLMLGVNVTGVFWTSIAGAGLQLFTHSNLKLHFGRFAWLVAGPQFHRIHHSILPEHQGKNLTQYFPLIDVLFGTYHHPRKEEFPPTGTTSLPTDAAMTKVMFRPIRTWLLGEDEINPLAEKANAEN